MNDEKMVMEALAVMQQLLTQIISGSKISRDEIENLANYGKKISCLSEENASNSIEVRVTRALEELGIPKNLLSYKYLRSAIILKFEKEDEMRFFTKQLYPEVARQYHTTWNQVERAIRHAIEVAWVRGCVEKQHELFGYTIASNKGKPTNSEFINAIVDGLKLGRI